MAEVSTENVGFHNFASREQLAQIGYASGDASFFGFLGVGSKVDGLPAEVDEGAVNWCGDGGGVSVFPAKLKDTVTGRPNTTNFKQYNSVKILPEFEKIC